ncbi:hypothetical protein JCM19233_3563 [Vibrio astriarenae]|nr:hypothetical protein JCM19233_3563 [Vibrio sp. C7]
MRTEVDSQTPVIVPYQRVSTVAQVNSKSQDGLGRQTRKTLEAAERLSSETGYRILNSVTDSGVSAFHKSNWNGEAGMGLIKSMTLSGEILKARLLYLKRSTDFPELNRCTFFDKCLIYSKLDSRYT